MSKSRKSRGKFAAFLLICALLIVPLNVFAHSGDTDENGGHYDSDTGEYHYHHGYPAHQHPNGICPYDFDDKTEHKEEHSKTPGISKTSERSIRATEKINFSDGIGLVFVVFCSILVQWLLLVRIVNALFFIGEERKNIMKEKLQSALGTFGIVLYYIFGVAAAILPVVVITDSFWLRVLFFAIMEFLPVSSIVFWIIAAAQVFTAPFSAFTVIFLIVMVVCFVPVFISSIFGLINAFTKNRD